MKEKCLTLPTNCQGKSYKNWKMNNFRELIFDDRLLISYHQQPRRAQFYVIFFLHPLVCWNFEGICLLFENLVPLCRKLVVTQILFYPNSPKIWTNSIFLFFPATLWEVSTMHKPLPRLNKCFEWCKYLSRIISINPIREIYFTSIDPSQPQIYCTPRERKNPPTNLSSLNKSCAKMDLCLCDYVMSAIFYVKHFLELLLVQSILQQKIEIVM